MSYDEFLGIFSKANLITDVFPERDVISCFAMSMMSQLDELESDRHMKMQRVEFYEAIARASEALSFAPPNGVVKFNSYYLIGGRVGPQKKTRTVPC